MANPSPRVEPVTTAPRPRRASRRASMLLPRRRDETNVGGRRAVGALVLSFGRFVDVEVIAGAGRMPLGLPGSGVESRL
jgi:hypothetical protein